MVNFHFNFAVATKILAALTSHVTQDEPCVTESDALDTCLEEKKDDDCLPCLFDAIMQIEMDDTCEEIAASSFCADLTTCFTQTCDADCGSQWEAFGTCIDAYVEANPDPTVETCEGLCKEPAAVLKATAFRHKPNNMVNFHSVATQKLAALTSHVTQDVPCETESNAADACIEEKKDDDCMSCLIDAIMQVEMDDTCEDIAASSYCTDVTTCFTQTCDTECVDKLKAVDTCITAYLEENYPDLETCEGLCEEPAAVLKATALRIALN